MECLSFRGVSISSIFSAKLYLDSFSGLEKIFRLILDEEKDGFQQKRNDNIEFIDSFGFCNFIKLLKNYKHVKCHGFIFRDLQLFIKVR